MNTHSNGGNSLSNNSTDMIADGVYGLDSVNVDYVGNFNHCPLRVDTDGANVGTKNSHESHYNAGSRQDVKAKKRKLNVYCQGQSHTVEAFNQILNLSLIDGHREILYL